MQRCVNKLRICYDESGFPEDFHETGFVCTIRISTFNESKQQILLAAAAAVSALSSVAAILFYRKGICETAEEISESFAYDEADLDIIKKLRHIQKAEEIVYNPLKDILKEVNSDKISGQMKNLLLELSTADVDFIFSKITRNSSFQG